MSDGKRLAPAISDHLPRLLTRARDQFLIDMRRHREEQGLPPVRPSQIKILALIPDDGANITELASRAGMTKQALGELVSGLEDGGYAVASRLTADRRVRIVTRTPCGTQLLASDLAAAAALEQEWRKIIGARRYDTMKTVLQELATRPTFRPGVEGDSRAPADPSR